MMACAVSRPGISMTRTLPNSRPSGTTTLLLLVVAVVCVSLDSATAFATPPGVHSLARHHHHPYVTLTPVTDEDSTNVSQEQVGKEEEDDSSVEQVSVFSVSSILPTIDLETSHVLSEEQANPVIRLGSADKQKIINGFGLWALCVSLLTGPVWVLAMMFVENVMYKLLPSSFDPHRSIFDSTGKLWAKTWLTMTQSYPSVSGNVELLKKQNTPCLFVANHASWLDIPILCTVLDPVFKFIAKGELQDVPCVGQQLKGGHHILIDRTDRRSQLRTFREGLNWLQTKGVPLMAFPEGQRSIDGKLLPFKGGVLQLARKANVPIVPISISHAHAVMPSNSYFPVQAGNNKLHVHVHDAIEHVAEMEEKELEDMVRNALLSGMPRDQHPLTTTD